MEIEDEFSKLFEQALNDTARFKTLHNGLRDRYFAALARSGVDELLAVLADAKRESVELFEEPDAQIVSLQAGAVVLDGAQKRRKELDRVLGAFLEQTPSTAQGPADLNLSQMTAGLSSLQKLAGDLRVRLEQIDPLLSESGGLRAVLKHEEDCLKQSLNQRDTRWSELAGALAKQTQQALESQNTDRAGELIRTLAEWKDMPDRPYDVALAADKTQNDYLKNWETQVQERRKAAAALRERADREDLIIEWRLALLGEAHEKLLEAQGLKAEVIAPEAIDATQEALQADIQAANESIKGVRGELWESVGAYLARLRQAELGKLVQDWKAAEATEVKREKLALFHKALVGADFPSDFLMAYAEWLEERTTFRREVEDALRMARENYAPEHITDIDALGVRMKQLLERLKDTEAPDESEITSLRAFEQCLSARVAQHAEQTMDRVWDVLEHEDLTQDRLDAQQNVLKTEIFPLKSLSTEQRQTLRTLQERIAERLPPDPDVKQLLSYLSDLATAASRSQLRFNPGKISALQMLEERRFNGDYSRLSVKERSALLGKMKEVLDAIDATDCAEDVRADPDFKPWLEGRHAWLERYLKAEIPTAAAPSAPVAEPQSVQEPMQTDSATTHDEALQ